MKRKLKLEILDAEENVVRTHQFNYDAEDSNSLKLTLGDRIFAMKPNGTLIIDAPLEQKPVKK